MKKPNQAMPKSVGEQQDDSAELSGQISETSSRDSEQAAAGSSSDFSRYTLSQNFGSVSGVKKKLLTVPVGKPSKTQFVRAHSVNKLDTMLLKYNEENYLIDPDVLHVVGDLARPYRLVEAIDRQGNVFIWTLALPDAEKPLNWHFSALEAANNAELEWTRMQANMALGAYDIFAAEQDLGGPEWPELSMNELLEIAFKNKIIDRPDHLVLLQLRGAA